jgi:hypothetical protein
MKRLSSEAEEGFTYRFLWASTFVFDSNGVQYMRPICVIAREIRAEWRKPFYGAVPYLDAMYSLHSIDDTYGVESAHDIVARFLSNAATWRGDTARRIKAELNAMLG